MLTPRALGFQRHDFSPTASLRGLAADPCNWWDEFGDCITPLNPNQTNLSIFQQLLGVALPDQSVAQAAPLSQAQPGLNLTAWLQRNSTAVYVGSALLVGMVFLGGRRR